MRNRDDTAAVDMDRVGRPTGHVNPAALERGSTLLPYDEVDRRTTDSSAARHPVPARRGRLAQTSSLRTQALVLFRLAVFGHAGPVYINFVVAPLPLPIWRGPTAALLNGLRACVAEFAAVLLCIAWRCERGRGEYYGKHSQTLLQVNHEAFPSIVAWSAERTPIAQHIYPLRKDLAQSILMQSIGFCGKVECSRDPRCTAWLIRVASVALWKR